MKMSHHNFWHAPILFAMFSAAYANPTQQSSQSMTEIMSSANIEAMKALPIDGLQMVKANGKTFFISRNGRFVIDGKLYDTWSRESITNINQVDEVANKIDLQKMKLKVDDLGPVTVGTGKPQVVIFVDPRCSFCAKVQQQLEGLKEQYTFKLIPLPVLGKESQVLVNKIGCLLQTKDKVKAQTYLLHQEFDALPAEISSDCSREPMQKAYITAQLFGINAVPFLIAADGRTFKGAPENLAAWLVNKQEPESHANEKDSTQKNGVKP